MPKSTPDKGKLPADAAGHVCTVVKEIVDRDFPGWGGKTRAAGELGLSQPQVSDLYNGQPGKVGLETILAIREYLRRKNRPHSLDYILGFHLPPKASSKEDLLRRAEETLAELRTTIHADASPARQDAARAAEKREAIRRTKEELAEARKPAAPKPASTRATGTHGRSR